MNQGQYGGMHGMHGTQGMPGMMPGQQGFPMQPIVCPTQYRFHDCFSTQDIPYIHPVVNVNRQNVVGVPQHYYTETTENVMGSMIMPGMPPRGPQFGPQFGPGHGGMWGGGGCCRGRGRC